MRCDDALTADDVAGFVAETRGAVKCVVGARNGGDRCVAEAIRGALPALEVLTVDSPEHGAAGLFPDRSRLVAVVHGLLGE